MDRTALQLVHLPVDPLMVDGAVVRNLAAAAPPQPLAHPTYPALVLKVAMLLYDHARRSALRQVGLQILHEAIAHRSCDRGSRRCCCCCRWPAALLQRTRISTIHDHIGPARKQTHTHTLHTGADEMGVLLLENNTHSNTTFACFSAVHHRETRNNSWIDICFVWLLLSETDTPRGKLPVVTGSCWCCW